MSERPQFPRTERDEAPLYLARYLERQAKAAEPEPEDDDTPLYLRRFRRRRETETITDQLPPLYQRVGHGMQQALSEDNRNKEISAPPAARPQIANEIYLIRHGETQGYSTESGLTPLGSWQAHTYGHTLAKRVKSGETIVVRHAATSRAGQTAESIHRGLLDGLALFEKDLKVFDPEPVQEFRNFAVATPEGM
ncbi:MAG: histidine phosphatase family protein, partial [Acidimicrobiia bacterium]